MPKIRVHELAKELEISSKELLNFLDKLEIKEKKAASNLSEDENSTVRNFFRNGAANTAKMPQPKKSEKTAPQVEPALKRPQAESPKATAQGEAPRVRRPAEQSASQRPAQPKASSSKTQPSQVQKPQETTQQSAKAQGDATTGVSGGQTQPSVSDRTQSQTTQPVSDRPQVQTQQPAGDRPQAQTQQTAGDRPQAQTQQPAGDRPQGQRPQGDRPGYQGQRPQGDRPPYQGQRPQGDRPQGDRPGYQGNRPQGDRPGYQGQRPQGDRPPYQGQRPQGDRPQGQGYQGNRPQGDRPQGQGYQGQRPQGDRPPYQGNRPQGDRPGYQGNRPQGDRPQGQGYQGQRPQGQGYQGNRPQGDRPQGQGYQGNRPQGDRPGYQGNRPQGDRPGYQGNRPQGDRPQGQRPGGQGGGARGGPAKPAATTATQQKPTNKRFDKAKDVTKTQNKQESMFGDQTAAVKQGPKTRKISKKEKRKIIQAEKEFEVARIQEEQEAIGIKVVSIGKNISVKDLAEKLGKPTAEIIKPLMKIGIMATINQEIDFYTASNIADSFDILVETADEIDILEEAFASDAVNEEALVERPPVVVVMGHVDHGKTSLLDSIRKSRVTDTEAGGITQHIGAYTVEINDKPITFLDTPGHEAFTAMRMRGAQVTDIAILVVAADDGVMPQTIEAINHAKAANVEIIVAINKIDRPSANPDRVKQELTEHGILTEDWGGETICVPVSALKGDGIDQLLEMILLAAEVRELKADPNRRAKGTVIESKLDRGRGPVATMLIQEGTLNIGDPIVAGGAHGRIRAMIDDKGERVKKAGPSIPVEIIGLNEVPMAGDVFYIADNERQARQVAESVVAQGREDMIKATPQKVSLDDLFTQIQAGNVKDLNIVIKADVAGSVEAVKNSLERLSNEEVRIRTIHGGVGAITESDVMLASASNAIIIGFNVRPENAAQTVASEEKVDIRLYRIIYNAIEDITAAMKGMLDPVFAEKVIGHAEIRQIFKASGVGNIAGSYITDGKFQRNAKVRVIRDGAVIHEGELAALRRFKDDVREVATGYECGLTFSSYNDIKEGDIVEAFVMEEVKR